MLLVPGQLEQFRQSVRVVVALKIDTAEDAVRKRVQRLKRFELLRPAHSLVVMVMFVGPLRQELRAGRLRGMVLRQKFVIILGTFEHFAEAVAGRLLLGQQNARVGRHLQSIDMMLFQFEAALGMGECLGVITLADQDLSHVRV